MRAAAAVLVLAAACAHGYTFMSIGDWGGAALDDYHTTDQYTVAKAFAAKADSNSAKFVIGTGDNFYYYGVKNVSDPQFQIDFERPYNQPSMMVPWYNVLGNHDYGYNVEAQIQYKSPNNNRWVLDARYYTRRIPLDDTHHISIIFLDSSPCVQDYRNNDPSKWDPCGSAFPFPPDCQFHENILTQDCGAQLAWVKQQIAALPADDWKFCVAHHPIDEIDAEPDFIDTLLSAKFDLYLNGHTHAMQFYQIDHHGAYVLTGAGAMVKTPDQVAYATAPAQTRQVGNTTHEFNSIWYQKVAGFTEHTFSADFETLYTTFYDYSGNRVYAFNSTRGHDPKPAPTPGPQSGKCAVYGCGTFDRDHPCQCNSKCTQYNDCCPDYKTEC